MRLVILLVPITVLLAGCVPTSSIQPVNSLAEIESGSVLVVGKIELDPPLASDEQTLGSSFEEWRNQIIVVTDTEPRDAGLLEYGDLGRRMQVPLGEFFFVKVPAEDFYILRSWVVMRAEIGQTGPANAPLDGIFKVDLRANDQAVYIGSIRYARDEFFRTKSVRLGNELSAAQAALRDRLGAGLTLRPALVQPVE